MASDAVSQFTIIKRGNVVERIKLCIVYPRTDGLTVTISLESGIIRNEIITRNHLEVQSKAHLFQALVTWRHADVRLANGEPVMNATAEVVVSMAQVDCRLFVPLGANKMDVRIGSGRSASHALRACILAPCEYDVPDYVAEPPSVPRYVSN